MMTIEELPGHHIDVKALDEIVKVLRCECGWGPKPTHTMDVDEAKQLHWAAKICEHDVLAFEDDVRRAITAIDDPQWSHRLNP